MQQNGSEIWHLQHVGLGTEAAIQDSGWLSLNSSKMATKIVDARAPYVHRPTRPTPKSIELS